jgi:hypothetical protein
VLVRGAVGVVAGPDRSSEGIRSEVTRDTV